jgi:hypothetical protein
VNAEQVAALRVLLAPTGWLERAALFAQALRRSSRTPAACWWWGPRNGHLAAHLDEESRLAGIPELAPTLVRWAPPVDAPAHLRIGLERIEAAGRGESLLVVIPQAAPDPLLERVQDARRGGATILALGQGDRPLEEMAHETLVVSPQEAPLSFEAAQHLVSAATGERPGESKGLRARLARLLDTVSGPAPR